MFGNRFEIAIQLFRDGVQRQIVFFAQQKKDVNPPVIGHTLKVPLQLFACFCRFRHTKSLYHIANNIPTFCRMLECCNKTNDKVGASIRPRRLRFDF